jgi:hypothetical protein
MKSVVLGKYGMVYRVDSNFVKLYPKKEFIRVSVRQGKKWKATRVSRKAQLRQVVPRIRKALQRSLSA